MATITIGENTVRREGYDAPYFIAEAGVNHEGDLDVAKQMVEAAARAGADAIKFQTYKAERLASRASQAYWDTTQEPAENQYELFKKHDAFWQKEYEILADHSADHGIQFLSTPFDQQAVDLLDSVVPAYKIASADITNLPLLEYVASKGKPVLLSTGASNLAEIHRALQALKEGGDPDIVLLHCVLNYPTPVEEANIGMITDLWKRFPDHVIGYSDHTLPARDPNPLLLAWSLGARVIEKHFTHDKTLEGNDHYHAYDEVDVSNFVDTLERLRKLTGGVQKQPLGSEEGARRHARRSLVARRDISQGQVIGPDDVAIKRPGTGLPPSMIRHVIGGRALSDIESDTVLTYEHLQLVSEDDH